MNRRSTVILSSETEAGYARMQLEWLIKTISGAEVRLSVLQTLSQTASGR